jgi:hypothetical protein
MLIVTTDIASFYWSFIVPVPLPSLSLIPFVVTQNGQSSNFREIKVLKNWPISVRNCKLILNTFSSLMLFGKLKS